MTPPVEGWQALFEALDSAKEDHALGGKTYAEVLRGILDRLALSDARLRAAQEGLARAHLPATPPQVASSTNVRHAPAGDDTPDFTTLARRFVRAMQRRYEETARTEPPRGVDEMLDAIGAKVEELAEMDEIELADAAVDLAVLALCLHKEARG
jgi:hypothetical protein